MTRMFRARVVRADGRTINVVQRRAHLSYCFTGCCCGRTERGYAAVPVDTFKDEWLRRKLRNVVHLTKAGCLGPCALANVASLVFDGRAVWFHSVNTPWHVRLIYDYIETMVQADRFVAPPSELTEYVFNYYDWDVRPGTEIPAASVSPGESGGQRIALLSHADTDLLALRRARTVLPSDLDVLGVSLVRVQTDEQLSLLLDGALAGVQVLVLRLHGELEGVPGFDRLRAWSIERTVPLVVVSGTGEPRADFARVSTAGPDVVDAVRTYLTLGGDHNLGECIRFLADRLLLTGYGSAPPLATPEHGVYLPEVENATIADWEQRRDPSKPTAAILFYRAHALTGNVAFIDEMIDALEQQETASSSRRACRLRADELVFEGIASRKRRRPRCACQPADAAPGHAPRWLFDRWRAGNERRIDDGAARARQLRRGTSAQSRDRRAFRTLAILHRVQSATGCIAETHGRVVGSADRPWRHAAQPGPPH